MLFLQLTTKMRIYTKGGDKGKTSLVTGTRVDKHHIRLESYGTIDELNSCIGLLYASKTSERNKAFLIWLQHKLFDLGSILATDDKEISFSLPEIRESDVLKIEQEIDFLNDQLEPLKYFILPGGSQLISFCHIARTVCRRAERRMVELDHEAGINEVLIHFINRLSDYLFMLSRIFAKEENVKEIKWLPQ